MYINSSVKYVEVFVKNKKVEENTKFGWPSLQLGTFIVTVYLVD